jgi:hypothetical protein
MELSVVKRNGTSIYCDLYLYALFYLITINFEHLKVFGKKVW